MPIDVVESFPDRLQGQVAPPHLPREGQRIDTLGQSLDLAPQTQNRGSLGLADEHTQILASAVLPVLEGAETQGETENDRGDGLPPSELPAGAGGGAQALENAPHVQASQSREEQQCSGVTREAAFAQADRGHRGGILGLGRRGGFQRQGRLLSLGRLILEQGRHADVGDSSARARHALGDGPRRESLSAQSAAAGLQLGSHLARTLRTGLARH